MRRPAAVRVVGPLQWIIYPALAAVAAGALVLPLAAQAEGYTSQNKTPASPSASIGSESNISSQQFSALDSDRSGSLSESEFSQHTTASFDFDKADTNADGNLTLSELNNAQVDNSR